MRDATRIKQLADEVLALIQDIPVIEKPGARSAINKRLVEIRDTADRMDARTGTRDPSWWDKLLGRR